MKKLFFYTILIFLTINCFSQDFSVIKKKPMVENKILKNIYTPKICTVEKYIYDENIIYSIIKDFKTDEFYLSKVDAIENKELFFKHLPFLTDNETFPVLGLKVTNLFKLTNKNIFCFELFTTESKIENSYFYCLYSPESEKIIHFVKGSFFTYPSSDKYFCALKSDVYEVFINDKNEFSTVQIKNNFSKNENVVFFKQIDDYFIVEFEKNKSILGLWERSMICSSDPDYYNFYICKTEKNILKKQKKIELATDCWYLDIKPTPDSSSAAGVPE